MRVFTVFSPHPKDYPSIEAQVLKHFSTPELQSFIVKEYGKKQTHPHLNVIWTTSLHKKYFSNMLKRKFTTNYSNEKLIRHKTVFNEETLKQGYLTKEAAAEVLYDYQTDKEYINQKHVELISEMLEDIKQQRKHRKMSSSRPKDGTGTKPILDIGDYLYNLKYPSENKNIEDTIGYELSKIPTWLNADTIEDINVNAPLPSWIKLPKDSTLQAQP